MNGYGEYRWPEGGKYIGEYINNVKEGKGTFYWTNGRVYDGEFSDGKPHGKGIITQGGKKYQVTFEAGKLVNKTKLPDDHYSGSYSHQNNIDNLLISGSGVVKSQKE